MSPLYTLWVGESGGRGKYRDRKDTHLAETVYVFCSQTKQKSQALWIHSLFLLLFLLLLLPLLPVPFTILLILILILSSSSGEENRYLSLRTC